MPNIYQFPLLRASHPILPIYARWPWPLRPRMIRVCLYVLIYYLFIKTVLIIVFRVPGPWGPAIAGVLPTGEAVMFQSRRHGAESDDRLTVKREGELREYWVNNTHALNIAYVTIKYVPETQTIFVENGGTPLSTLKLDTDKFYREGQPQPAWLTSGRATTIAEGWTRYFLLELVWPL